jgi:histidinol-phosphate aminotransferase
VPRALEAVRQPFFCNAAAQAAATAALDHPEEVARRVALALAARVQLEDGLGALGFEPARSQANFCWFELGDGRSEADVVRGLAEEGVLVRAGSALGKDGALRVSYGTEPENARFLEVLGGLV